MPGNPLVRFDEGRVGRTRKVSPSLLLYRSSAAIGFSGFANAPLSLRAGAGSRCAGILLGLIRLCLHIGQAGLDEEQVRRFIPAGVPGARIVEGYADVVQVPGERQLRTLPLKRQVEQTISISAPNRTASSNWTDAPEREMSSKLAIASSTV